MYYLGEGIYPVYHSVHDTYKWLQGLVDTNFSYHLTVTQVAARALMSTVDSIVLPLDVRQYAKSLRKSFKNLNDTYSMELRQNNITLHYIDTAIIRWDHCIFFLDDFPFLVKTMVLILVLRAYIQFTSASSLNHDQAMFTIMSAKTQAMQSKR
jgi:hypothetical protein